jgi:hypothetical protein
LTDAKDHMNLGYELTGRTVYIVYWQFGHKQLFDWDKALDLINRLKDLGVEVEVSFSPEIRIRKKGFKEIV